MRQVSGDLSFPACHPSVGGGCWKRGHFRRESARRRRLSLLCVPAASLPPCPPVASEDLEEAPDGWMFDKELTEGRLLPAEHSRARSGQQMSTTSSCPREFRVRS